MVRGFQEGGLAGYDVDYGEDLYEDGAWTIRKEWRIDYKGKRIPDTTVFAVYENDDGDFPLFNSFKEAKAFILSEDPIIPEYWL